MKTRSISVVAFIVALIATVAASVPTTINYQGRLTDGSANPVPDGTYSVAFTIYDAASGGNIKWTETQTVSTSSGLFAVLLGSINPIIDTVFRVPSRYLGIKVGAYPEISPRTMIVTAPWSFRTSTVDGAKGGAISGNVDVSGKTTMAEFQMPTGAAEYYVLVSDSLGNGTWQTTTGSHNTLDEAYDQNGGGAGRVIHADSGSVEIHGTPYDDALYVPDMSMVGANTNALIKTSHHGTGPAILVEHTDTGDGMDITHSNAGKGIVVDHSGTNIGIDVALSNTANTKPGIQ